MKIQISKPKQIKGKQRKPYHQNTKRYKSKPRHSNIQKTSKQTLKTPTNPTIKNQNIQSKPINHKSNLQRNPKSPTKPKSTLPQNKTALNTS